jgi:hypothetical protein
MPALIFIVALPGVAMADGAIAVGLPKDVAKQGVAIGTSWNYPNPEGANARALQECLSFMDAPPDTRKLCKVMQTFNRECVAVAIDPQAGTPGVGWAVAPAKSGAESSALQRCKNTAGAGRQQFCKITVTHCDGQ